MKLPRSVSSIERCYVPPDQQYLYQEEDDDSSTCHAPVGMLQTVHITIPFHIYTSLISTRQYDKVIQQQRHKPLLIQQNPYPLEYPITLRTIPFFEEWTPAAYHKGIFSNASYWNTLKEWYYTGCSRHQMFLLVAMTNKSNLSIIPFLRTGHLTPAFLRRCKTWFSQPELYGYFPFYYQFMSVTSSRMSYHQFLTTTLTTLTKKELEKGAQQFIKELDDLFDQSPSITYPLVVYRGVKDDMFESLTEWTDPSYVSTTLHPLHAFHYKHMMRPCCVQRITIPPHIKVLFLEGISSFEKEWEILLPRGLTFHKTHQQESQVPSHDQWSRQNPSRYQSVLFQEVVITTKKKSLQKTVDP